VLAFIAILLSILALVGRSEESLDSASPSRSSPPDADMQGDEISGLQARVAALESALAERRREVGIALDPAVDPVRPRPETTALDEAELTDSQRLTTLREIELRLANLEAANAKAAAVTKALAAPSSIPAALAVLLASRGVVTKVGDIEAIQRNLNVLAALAADSSRSDWERIEAYRGMLMFGYDEPQKCIDAMPDIAAILLSSSDAKARSSAAAMLSTYENPLIMGTVLTAFETERDVATRGAILQALRPFLSDPAVQRALANAAAKEPNKELRARIRKAIR
jgi:hypothetical protein